MAAQWLKAQFSLIYRCGGSAGMVRVIRAHRLPCFTLPIKDCRAPETSREG